VLNQALHREGVWGGWGKIITPRILIFYTRWRWTVKFFPRSLHKGKQVPNK